MGDQQRVAVIPARGGSKRVPRKNVRVLDGRPLVAWAIGACLDAGVFDRVVVSTDDDEVAQVARDAGAEVPFRRDDSLSDDHTPLVPVVADAVLALSLDPDDLVCCVYPTAAVLDPSDLAASMLLLSEQSSRPYVVAVTSYPHPVQRALARDQAGALSMVDPEQALTRTQDLEPRWHDAGQFVWGRASAWLTGTAVLTHALGYVVPPWRAIDLDTEDDWVRAELLHPLLRRRALG